MENRKDNGFFFFFFFEQNKAEQENASEEEQEVRNYLNNLSFYTMLKLLVKAKLSNSQLTRFQQALVSYRKTLLADHSAGVTALFNSECVMGTDVKSAEDFMTFLSFEGFGSSEMWWDCAMVATLLFQIKPLLIEEAKAFASTNSSALSAASDPLCLKFDSSNLSRPYGTRVAGSMIVFGLDPNRKQSMFLLKSSESLVAKVVKASEGLNKAYGIDAAGMYSILINESINQSIISDGGGSYEERVRTAISAIPGVANLKGHSHDSHNSSIEYDFTFTFEGKLFGVSAKRTVRERYKQNLQHSDLLDVDFMILISLGTDINEGKMNNILHYRGYYLVVAEEVWAACEYMRRSFKVIPSSRFNADELHRLIGA